MKVGNIFAVCVVLSLCCVDANPTELSCGQIGTNVSERVFGGKEVAANKWKWLVAIYYKPSKQFKCGGSLISSKHVLSGMDNFFLFVIFLLI